MCLLSLFALKPNEANFGTQGIGSVAEEEKYPEYKRQSGNPSNGESKRRMGREVSFIHKVGADWRRVAY